MSAESIIADARERMQKAVAATQRELGTIRTGKASVSLLDTVRVDYYGNKVPLNQAASISVPEARLLVVQPWEKQLVAEISKAILQAELGLNPVVDGTLIRVPVPALNEERRREMVKLAKKHAEEGRVAIRNVRRDANEHLKKAEKAKEISEDDDRRAHAEIQKITDELIADLDKIVETKETEVMEV
jgi:ribosome recycling factor